MRVVTYTKKIGGTKINLTRDEMLMIGKSCYGNRDYMHYETAKDVNYTVHNLDNRSNDRLIENFSWLMSIAFGCVENKTMCLEDEIFYSNCKEERKQIKKQHRLYKKFVEIYSANRDVQFGIISNREKVA